LLIRDSIIPYCEK